MSVSEVKFKTITHAHEDLCSMWLKEFLFVLFYRQSIPDFTPRKFYSRVLRILFPVFTHGIWNHWVKVKIVEYLIPIIINLFAYLTFFIEWNTPIFCLSGALGLSVNSTDLDLEVCYLPLLDQLGFWLCKAMVLVCKLFSFRTYRASAMTNFKLHCPLIKPSRLVSVSWPDATLYAA